MAGALQCYLRVSIILSILSLAVPAEDYFVYFPNVVIPGTLHTVPVFVSSQPALLTVSHAPNVTMSYKIMQKYSNIPLSIDSANDTVALDVKLYVCSNGKYCGENNLTKLALNRTFQLPLSQNSYLFKVFTSKTSYKSSETIKIIVFLVRFDEILGLPSTFNRNFFAQTYTNRTRREVSKLSVKIYKNKTHLEKAWLVNVTDKFVVIKHKIGKKVKDGTWMVEVVLNGRHRVTRHFKVISQRISSILNNSNIKIDIIYDNDLTIVAKNIRFSVCARYSGFRALKGSVKGNICVRPEKTITAIERPCVRYNSSFDGSDLCVVIKKDIEPLDLRNRSYANIHDKLVITAKVFDELSRNTKFFNFHGPNVADTKYKITFLSELYFKTNLPYYGKVLVSKNNDEPYANAKILIQCNTVNFPYNWGHYSHHLSDRNGIVHFILSPPPAKLTVITCDIEDRFQMEDKEGEVTYYRPTITVSIDKWKSTSDEEIQLKLISRTSSNKSDEVVTLEMQGNRVFEDDFVLLLISNGFVLRSKFVSKEDLVKQKCVNRDDELGHYRCANKTGTIACLQNWYGRNCLRPRCHGNCNHGICLEPDRCICKYGWSGKFCDKCTKKKDCVHGECKYGNDCVCKKNWKGQNCDHKYVESGNVRRNKGKTVKRATNWNGSNDTPQAFIYSTRLSLEIPFLVNSFYFLMHSLTKHPFTATLRVDPRESFVSVHETNEIDISYLNFSDLYSTRKTKCLYGNTFYKIRLLFSDNKTFVNPISDKILGAYYKSIISEQCKMPFSETNRTNMSNIIAQEIFPDENDITNYDLLHTLQTLRITPISSIKMVFRNCVMQMIRDKYKIYFPAPPTAAKLFSPKMRELKDKSSSRNIYNGVSSTRLFYDINDLKPHLKPYQLSSLCFDVDNKKPIITRNVYLDVKPLILITIGTLKSIKINEVHYIPIYVVKTTEEPIEVNVKIETFSKCVSRKYAIKIIMLLNNTNSYTIREKISFTCSGIFKVKLTFQYRKMSTIYPNMTTNVNNTITKTEYVVYKVNEGIYQYKTFHYTFCLLKESTKVRIRLPADLHPNKNVKLKIEIENSLDYILKYLRYIYTNQKMKNIIKLTLEIYEMNLNKIQERDRSYLNQSMDNIKKLLVTESSILKKANGNVPDEHMLSLVNLCGKILSQHYVWKKPICKLVSSSLKEVKTDGLECYKFSNGTSGNNSLILILFIKQNKYLFKKEVNLLRYIQTCYKVLNITTKSSTLDEIIKLDNRSLSMLNETTAMRWIDAEEDEVILATLYFHFQEKLILSKIVKKLIDKVNKNLLRHTDNREILLLKVFSNFEIRFQNKTSLKSEPTRTSTVFRSFNVWTGKDTVELALSTINACSLVTAHTRYYQSYVHKPSPSSIEMHLDKNNCDQATIIVNLNGKIQTFDFLLVSYPSAWTLDLKHSDKDLVACNLIVTNDANPSTTKIDFRMVTGNCSLGKLVFSVLKYQNVTSYRASYGVLSTKTGQEFYLEFTVPKCSVKSESVVYVNDNLSDICKKEHFVVIKYDKYEIKIDNDYVVSVAATSLNLTNRLEIFTTDRRRIVIAVDDLLLWSTRTAYDNLCDLWKVINNVFLHVINATIGADELHCQLTNSFSNHLTTNLVCLNYLYAYNITKIRMASGELQLQHLPTKCSVKQTLRVFDFNFSVGKNFSKVCLFTLSGGNLSDSKLILLSKFNLIGGRETNRRALTLSNDHFVLKL